MNRNLSEIWKSLKTPVTGSILICFRDLYLLWYKSHGSNNSYKIWRNYATGKIVLLFIKCIIIIYYK